MDELRGTHPADVSPAPEAPPVYGQLEANFSVLFVLVVTIRPLKLGDAAHLRSPLRGVVHVVGASCGERRHGSNGPAAAATAGAAATGSRSWSTGLTKKTPALFSGAVFFLFLRELSPCLYRRASIRPLSHRSAVMASRSTPCLQASRYHSSSECGVKW